MAKYNQLTHLLFKGLKNSYGLRVDTAADSALVICGAGIK